MNFKSKGYRIFEVINYIFLTLLALVCLLPIVHIASLSISHASYVAANKVTFWPIDPHIFNYKIIFEQTPLIINMWVSVRRVVIGTAVNMFLILLTSYPLSRENKDFKGRNKYMWFLIIPLVLHAGLIPTYVLLGQLNLIGKFWVLIFPTAVNIWSIIMMMNFFRRLPKELYEAAYIDGAGHMKILFWIFVPLSTAAIATLTLFASVGHWNQWFDGLIYMRKIEQRPLMSSLKSLMTASAHIVGQEDLYTPEELARLSDRSLMAAKIMFTTIPILIVYPFLQKYFVKGLVIGSVKG